MFLTTDCRAAVRLESSQGSPPSEIQIGNGETYDFDLVPSAAGNLLLGRDERGWRVARIHANRVR